MHNIMLIVMNCCSLKQQEIELPSITGSLGSSNYSHYVERFLHNSTLRSSHIMHDYHTLLAIHVVLDQHNDY